MNDAPSLDFIQYIVKYMNKFDDDANDASYAETKDCERHERREGRASTPLRPMSKDFSRSFFERKLLLLVKFPI